MARSHPVDIHVGGRMRQQRTLLGMSQTKLGTAVGLTFQQIQKYERGSNRIGSSRLFEFAKVLGVPVEFFFDEMPSGVLAGRPAGKNQSQGRAPYERDKDPLHQRKTLELARNFHAINDAGVQRSLFAAVKAASKVRAPANDAGKRPRTRTVRQGARPALRIASSR